MTNNQLTDERVTSVIERLEHYACNLKWTNVRGAQDLLAAADGLRELQERRKAAMDSEPVAWTWHYREQWHVTNDKCRAEFVATDGDVAVLPLYRHAQPAPEKYNIGDATMRHIFTPTGMTNVSDMQAVFDRVEAVLVGMDQPAPVVPDGYVMVPMRLTAENGAKGALSGEFSETKFVNCPECFGDDECETCDGSGRIEITVPVTWTTIKDIWAKGVEHFSATPREVKGE
ncbi:Eaa1 [Klebsiella quasipneumoniae]|nr:Eaa1 [Klebsiella quasipneumoniae]